MTPVDPVATTALWVAAERARESARPDRLFDDSLAETLPWPRWTLGGPGAAAPRPAGRTAGT